jgi:3-oxoacyl-[acyl-carrier protein] reductase
VNRSTADLAGRSALVTGGARGIGRSIALTLAQRGARVAVVDTDADLGTSTATQCGGTFIRADVREQSDVAEAVARTLEDFGGLQILVNNAGIARFADFFEVDAELWETILAVNLRGTFLFMSEAALHMRDHGGGSIINIASVSAKGYRHASSVAYAASKAGVLGLTRTAAMQLARYGIRVNAICPGIVQTDLNRGWLADHPDRITEIPLGRACEPEDIAALAAFLSSDAAATTTGQAWNVDGGLNPL